MRKPKRRRTTPGKVSAPQREKALKAHAEIIADPTLPAYVRAKSASAILNEGARADSADESDVDPEAGRKQLTIHWNSRPMLLDGKPVLPRFGAYADDQKVIQIPEGYDLNDPQAEEHYAPYVALWWEAHEARMAAVRLKMANAGIAPRPVIKLANGEFEFADKIGGAGDFIWRQARIKASALATVQAALPAPATP